MGVFCAPKAWLSLENIFAGAPNSLQNLGVYPCTFNPGNSGWLATSYGMRCLGLFVCSASAAILSAGCCLSQIQRVWFFLTQIG